MRGSGAGKSTGRHASGIDLAYLVGAKPVAALMSRVQYVSCIENMTQQEYKVCDC